MDVTVIDIETTGLSKHYHQITEIAAAKIRDGEIKGTFQTLVNPQVKIPSFITRLTGIDDDMVKDAPVISAVIPDFLSFVGDDVFVAHNATFDFGFLFENCRRNGHSLDNRRLCTRKLANRLFPELSRKRLGDLCELLSVQNNNAHRAMSDVLATTEVFNHMLTLLATEGVTKPEQIFKFEKSPRRNF